MGEPRGAPTPGKGHGGVLGALGTPSDKHKASHSSLSLRTEASAGHRPFHQAGPGSSPGFPDTQTGLLNHRDQTCWSDDCEPLLPGLRVCWSIPSSPAQTLG